MFRHFFSKQQPANPSASNTTFVPKMDEQGLSYALSLANEEQYWQLAAYLDQLFEEDYASQLSDRWLISWQLLYELMAQPEHESSIALLALPQVSSLRPVLASSGSLASEDFRVFIKAWRDGANGSIVSVERTGAVIQSGGKTELLAESAWNVVQAVQTLAKAQQEAPGEATNQIGWANIRKLAKAANAELDGFLDKTIVVKPQKLQLKPRKTVVGDTPVIELGVAFDDQPENWLANFDQYQQVQDRYRVQGSDGSVTHVLIEPEIRDVLESVKALPGRRVAGDDALNLVRNPYTVIGDFADKVLDPQEYESSLIEAGIYFHRFRVEPQLADDGKTIESIRLLLEPIAAEPQPEISLDFHAPHEFAPFVGELQVKLAAGFPAGLWRGYELELSDFSLKQMSALNELLQLWQRQAVGQTFDAVLDLSSYGDRVIGIGEAEKVTSPFLIKTAAENWLPDDIGALGLDNELLRQWDPQNIEHFEEFKQRLDQARTSGLDRVHLPESETPLPMHVAEQLYDSWSKKVSTNASAGSKGEGHGPRVVLQIEQNIEEATFAPRREATLLAGHHANADLPELLKPEIQLREHQLKGVAWMQHLFSLSPNHVAGCLLADDMGLGKTIQLLTFIVWYLEQQPAGEPVLIVAPVSLLDNWERELRRFFYADNLGIMKLYGNELRALKFHKGEIPSELRGRGIKNLLRPGWIGENRIVLTTYETMRDQEFSLARQQWSIMVCDEAQKIKSPIALITQAAKAIPTRFRIACTGTPVENTLIDLWCLFDFIQPGFLGSLNQFGREYQRPIETNQERDTGALERLRTLIEPQTLRRTKQDVAKDLPAKIEDDSCKALSMYSVQRDLYISELARFSQKQQVQERLEQKESGMLGLLHRLKLICAHPFSVEPDPRLRDYSPKLRWLISQLEQIRHSTPDDKVIIFTELRDIQRELQHAILQHFGFKPTVINGDTSTNSNSAFNRQSMIDSFQAQQGFSVIILSTIAVGFGVNVQAANHVIHFTRCWNPAKEDQATDRAYRIGQQKDVYVYYPTVKDSHMPTFETTLDELLQKRRSLARDMLHASSEIQASEFSELLKGQG